MLRKLEKWFIVLSILFFAGGLIPVQRAQSEKSVGLNQINSVLQSVLFVLLTFFVCTHFKSTLNGLRRVKGVVAICLLAVLSSLWSLEPVFSLRRSVIFCAMTIFTIYFSERFTFKDQAGIMYLAVIFEIFASFATAFLLPNAGISSDLHAGAWKGLFIHKNNLGQFMGISVLFLLLARPASSNKTFRVFLILAAATVLYLSQSATPLFGVLISLLALAIIALSRIQKRANLPLWIGVAPLLISIGTLLIVLREFVLSAAGKDTTLSGRLPIWHATLASILQRPWLGYGYSAFWETQNIYALGVRNLIQWPGAPHAHNGYIDTLVDLGAVGLGMFLFIYLRSLIEAVRRFRNKRGTYPGWSLAILIFFAFYNLTESNLVQSHTFMWLPFVWVTCELAKKRDLAPSRQSHQEAEEAKLEYA